MSEVAYQVVDEIVLPVWEAAKIPTTSWQIARDQIITGHQVKTALHPSYKQLKKNISRN